MIVCGECDTPVRVEHDKFPDFPYICGNCGIEFGKNMVGMNGGQCFEKEKLQ